MDSVFVEAGYSGLESVEKNVFDNFLEICKHPFFSEQFQKSICSGSFSAVAGCRLQSCNFIKKEPRYKVFLIFSKVLGADNLKCPHKNICDGV